MKRRDFLAGLLCGATILGLDAVMTPRQRVYSFPSDLGRPTPAIMLVTTDGRHVPAVYDKTSGLFVLHTGHDPVTIVGVEYKRRPLPEFGEVSPVMVPIAFEPIDYHPGLTLEMDVSLNGLRLRPEQLAA